MISPHAQGPLNSGAKQTCPHSLQVSVQLTQVSTHPFLPLQARISLCEAAPELPGSRDSGGAYT